MEKIKVVLDRERVSSEEIASRQDLNSVLKGATTNTPVWKSGWFYGTVGLASVAIVAITATWNQSPNVESQKERVLTASLTDSSVIPAIEQPQNSVRVHEVSNEEVEMPVVEKKKEAVSSKSTSLKSDEKETESDEQQIVESTPVSYTSVTPKPDHGIAKVNGVVNKMPNIAGIYYGPISIEKLCSDNRISSSPDIEITSFKINYNTMDGNVVKSVSGDVIPSDICSQLKRWNLNSTVFITEIRGVSTHGEVLMLSSMSLIPTK